MKKQFIYLGAALLLFAGSCYTPAKNNDNTPESSAKQAASIEFIQSNIERRQSAPYSEAVRIGDILFLTGQVGFNNDSLKLASGGIKAEATQALENIKAVLEANGSDFTITFSVAFVADGAALGVILSLLIDGKLETLFSKTLCKFCAACDATAVALSLEGGASGICVGTSPLRVACMTEFAALKYTCSNVAAAGFESCFVALLWVEPTVIKPLLFEAAKWDCCVIG